MRVAILLLCHEAPAQLAARLSSPFFRDPALKVYLHYDARRSDAELETLRASLPGDLQFEFVRQRVRCGWGEFSLVDATHRLMKLALADPDFAADYLALISGSCVPFRPFASLQEFLRRRRGIDFIQAHDIRRGPWVAGGLEEERYRYYFPLNFQTHRWAFDQLTHWQRRLKVTREQPADVDIHFGSQWFCLTRDTSEHVAMRLDEPKLRQFFARSWIPDEFAIQSLVATHRKPAFIAGHTLTYYEFNTQGLPLVLDNGHLSHLLKQPFFFARKVAPEAKELLSQIEMSVRQTEYDLSYFDRIGHATNDFHSYLAHALERKSARSHIGTVKDGWRGPMDVSQRRYYVLYATSRSYLLRLLSEARREREGLPVFDLLFDPAVLQPAGDRGAYLGVQVSDRLRRDHDPCAFLHEVVHIDAERPAAFGLDPGVACWVRDFVVWDRNATLIDCDPASLSPAQRAMTAVRDMEHARDLKRVAQTVAGALQAKPLPHDHFQQARDKGEHSCRFLALGALDDDSADPTLRALHAAARRVDAASLYLPPGEAEAALLGQVPA